MATVLDEIRAKLPEGITLGRIRGQVPAMLRNPRRIVCVCSFVVIASTATSVDIFVARRDKGKTIFTASSAVLAHLCFTRAHASILAQTEPLARTRGMDDNAWRDVLVEACKTIKIDVAYLDRIDELARRAPRETRPDASDAIETERGTETSVLRVQRPVEIPVDLSSRSRRGEPKGFVPHQRPRRPDFLFGRRYET